MRCELRVAVVVGALLASGAADADGLGFDGDKPRFPHFLLKLDAAQRNRLNLNAGQGDPVAEVQLTPEQRATAKRATGKTVGWLFAATRKQVEGDCTCGAYNLSVILGDSLAVYTGEVGDFLSPAELAAIDTRIKGQASASSAARRDWPPTLKSIIPGLSRSAAFDTMVGKLPARRFERTIQFPTPWQAVQVKLPALPRVAYEKGADNLDLFLDAGQIRSQPGKSGKVAWPDGAARLQTAEGATLWVLPAVALPGIGAPERAWALFEYRGGRLTAVVAVPEGGDPMGWIDESAVSQERVNQ